MRPDRTNVVVCPTCRAPRGVACEQPHEERVLAARNWIPPLPPPAKENGVMPRRTKTRPQLFEQWKTARSSLDKAISVGDYATAKELLAELEAFHVSIRTSEWRTRAFTASKENA